jgi:hypothetical protein
MRCSIFTTFEIIDGVNTVKHISKWEESRWRNGEGVDNNYMP